MLLVDWLKRKLMGGRVAPKPAAPIVAPAPRPERERAGQDAAVAFAISEWHFTAGQADVVGRVVWAMTKSEARGRMKKLLGLDRLPPGTRCERVSDGRVDG